MMYEEPGDISTCSSGVVVECPTVHLKCKILIQCAYYEINTGWSGG